MKHLRTKQGVITGIYYSQVARSKLKGLALPKYTLEQLRAWMFTQPNFEELYNNWKKSGYEKDLVPSVDRIDDYKGYSFDNIQLTTWEENNRKGYSDRKNGINNKISKVVIQYDLNGNKLKKYHSVREAGRRTGINHRNISKCCLKYKRHSRAGKFKWEFNN